MHAWRKLSVALALVGVMGMAPLVRPAPADAAAYCTSGHYVNGRWVPRHCYSRRHWVPGRYVYGHWVPGHYVYD